MLNFILFMLLLLLLLLFKTLQCTYVYLYHTYKPLQGLSSQVALMVHSATCELNPCNGLYV